MSSSEPTGKLGKATKIVADHPALSALALFAIAGSVVAVVRRQNRQFEDIELPEATEVRDENLGDLASVRDNDRPLKDLALSDDIEDTDKETTL